MYTPWVLAAWLKYVYHTPLAQVVGPGIFLVGPTGLALGAFDAGAAPEVRDAALGFECVLLKSPGC